MIVAVDRFGNLISNISAAQVVALANPTIHIGGMRLPLRRTYGDTPPGEYLGLSIPSKSWRLRDRAATPPRGLNLAVGAAISAVPGGLAPNSGAVDKWRESAIVRSLIACPTGTQLTVSE